MNVAVLRVERGKKFVKLGRRRLGLADTRALAAGQLLEGAHELGARVSVERVGHFQVGTLRGKLGDWRTRCCVGVMNCCDRLKPHFLEQTNSVIYKDGYICLLYTSPSPRDGLLSRMPSSA